MEESKQSFRETLVSVILIAFCAVAAFMGIYLFTGSGNYAKSNETTVDVSSKELMSSLSISKKDKVAVIGLQGVIMDSFRGRSPFESNLNSAGFKHELEKALEDAEKAKEMMRELLCKY